MVRVPADSTIPAVLYVVCCVWPEAAALQQPQTWWTTNRDSLVAGLQEGATDVSFQLKGCNDAEFTVLCKAMAVQGPAVRRVVNESPPGSFYADRHIDAFVTALASCSHLVELRWVLCFPSSCPAATTCGQCM